MRKIGVAIVVLVALAAGAAQALARTQASSSVTATAKTSQASRTRLAWTVQGKVASSNSACRAARKVKLVFVYEKPPFVKAAGTTAKNGSFKLEELLNVSGEQPREIQVTVPESKAGGITCKEAKTTVPTG